MKRILIYNSGEDWEIIQLIQLILSLQNHF